MLRDMKVQTHVKPGQPGAKRLTEQYGDALLCVRYRHDRTRGVILKTVELVVEELPQRSGRSYRDGDLVGVAVASGEKRLRERLKSLGGRWLAAEKLWQIPFGVIRGDGELVERIVEQKNSR